MVIIELMLHFPIFLFFNNGILLIFFSTNVWYSHLRYVDCNTVHICMASYCINAHKVIYLLHPKHSHVWVLLLRDTSDIFRIMACIVSINFWLRLQFFYWCHIDLSHFMLTHHNPVYYIFICEIYFWSCKNMNEWQFWF